VAQSNYAADFVEYLRKYPSGQFTGLARNKVASLRPPENQTTSRRRDVNFLSGMWCQVTKIEGLKDGKIKFAVSSNQKILEDSFYTPDETGNEVHVSSEKIVKFLQPDKIKLIDDDERYPAIKGVYVIYEIVNDNLIRAVLWNNTLYERKGSIVYSRCNKL
jgi:hypothetical protein